jgi:predicted metal-dependent HD superfamily phosphohydrolase
MINWSRLPDDTRSRAVWRYGSIPFEPNRFYHNITHIDRMYRAAGKLDIPYSRNLDIAILYHDIIYDAEGNNELRSINRLYDDWGDITKDYAQSAFPITKDDLREIESLILTTRYDKWSRYRFKEDYIPDNRLVLLDLYDFADHAQRIENYANVMRESMGLYGCTEIEFAKANRDFLNELWRQLPKFMDDREIWKDIKRGVMHTITISEGIIFHG